MRRSGSGARLRQTCLEGYAIGPGGETRKIPIPAPEKSGVARVKAGCRLSGSVNRSTAGVARLVEGTSLAPDHGMKAAVFYATREGHTRKIADRIAEDLRRHGIDTDVMNVRDIEEVSWGLYSAACVAASVHIGKHEPEMVAFVKRYRTQLSRLGAAFVSVTLSEAGAEDPNEPA